MYSNLRNRETIREANETGGEKDGVEREDKEVNKDGLMILSYELFHRKEKRG